MSSFQKQKYLVIKNIISKDTALILFNYLRLKQHVWNTMKKTNYPGANYEMGGFDKQVNDTWGCYSDLAMETLLEMLRPIIEKEANIKLVPMYSYTRLYKKGDILEKHKDRPSCEISTTLNLGGDPWSIFIEPNKNIGKIKNKKYYPGSTKGTEIKLDPGDLLLYLGVDCEHWREKFKGEICAQVFLHYSKLNTKYAKDYVYDSRPHLGLPLSFMNKPVKRKGYV
jgi:hypothetical protein|tara:strand:- start:179 stop:853 length:675 start_codon:yes stop_codon:yes gene_type:complete